VGGDPRGHVADRAEAEDRDAAAIGHACVLHRLPGGRQHVGEVYEPLVRAVLRQLDRAVVGVLDSHVLGLAAGDLAVELRVAVELCPHALLADLGRLALGLKALVTHEAVPAGDLERHHHAVTWHEIRDLPADLPHDPHRLVAEDVALAHERAQDLVEVKVGAADVRRRDLDDRVGGILDRGVRDILVADVALALPSECLHG
jgi:hypothetical protein